MCIADAIWMRGINIVDKSLLVCFCTALVGWEMNGWLIIHSICFSVNFVMDNLYVILKLCYAKTVLNYSK